jgi:Ca2+-binding EF-hand superfamily protein
VDIDEFKFQSSKKNGVIDFDEFLSGLKVYSRGSMEEKIKMLFKMYDLADSQLIDPEELSTMLMSLLAPSSLIEHHASSPKITKCTQDSVQKIVQDAFESCDVDRNGKLSFSEFYDWIMKNPDVSQKLEEAMVVYTWHPLINSEEKDKERNSFLYKVPSWNDMKQRLHMNSSSSGDLKSANLKLRCPNCKWQPKFCSECGHRVASDQEDCSLFFSS